MKHDLINAVIKHFQTSSLRVEKCLNEISEEKLWTDFNENLVSVGNLILHLCGNLTQYIISGLGDEKFFRERDKEFIDKPKINKHALLIKFYDVVEKCYAVFQSLTEEKMKQKYLVQGFSYNGTEILLHVSEHLSYHVGQITFAVKLLYNKDMGYYKNIDLNKQNKYD